MKAPLAYAAELVPIVLVTLVHAPLVESQLYDILFTVAVCPFDGLDGKDIIFFLYKKTSV
jgi:hypothetical protein